ncbi:SKP1-like protein 1A [Senna tora]|uniref:SKP1-like protein n=1 Tax=Senna tora TaxID=362788 RepID=A0A835CII6_9FABA|nr:SKP1-like protein 1A [Senna tora]
MSSSSLKKQKLILMSSDGVVFEVEKEVATEIGSMKQLIGDNRSIHGIIPLPNINASILSLVLEYCRKHSEAEIAAAAADNSLKAWDAEFMRRVDNNFDSLCDLITAANSLDIESLTDLTMTALANVIKSKSCEELQRDFNM